MCVGIWFKHEKRDVGSIAELSDMLGGDDKIVISQPEEYPPIAELRDGCLCPVDIEATMAATDYIMTKWEHGCDWTARKPDWLVEQDRRERDKARYDAAMAEMRAQRTPQCPLTNKHG